MMLKIFRSLLGFKEKSIPVEKYETNKWPEKINQLVEFKDVSQKESGVRRRWFSDDNYELIVWYDLAGQIIGFQICYGGLERGNAITYSGGSFTHRKFTHETFNNATPVFSQDAGPVSQQRVQDFLEHTGMVEPEIRKYIKNIIYQKMH